MDAAPQYGYGDTGWMFTATYDDELNIIVIRPTS